MSGQNQIKKKKKKQEKTGSRLQAQLA